MHAALTFSASPWHGQLRDAPRSPRLRGPDARAHRRRDRVPRRRPALAVIDEEPDARLLPSGLVARLREPLARRAERAVRAARLEGVVRCFFPADRPDAPAPVLLPGLDAATLDLYDAVHTRGLCVRRRPTPPSAAHRAAGSGHVAVQREARTPRRPLGCWRPPPRGNWAPAPGLFRARVFHPAPATSTGSPGPACGCGTP
ncbi:hypothetical protein GCM10023238_36630 [Streptomyces heliomycini]